tara:strand:- start:1619 stop:2044 length:426 start_codon:yes stop_codon:yes gene_type:complete
MELTVENVKTLMRACLYQDGDKGFNGRDVPSDAIVVCGITRTFGFNPTRVREQTRNILNILENVSDKFLTTGGGGASFLELPFDKDGKHWGEHINAEELYALSAAIGVGSFALDKDMWHILPGGVPYIQIRMPENFDEMEY